MASIFQGILKTLVASAGLHVFNQCALLDQSHYTYVTFSSYGAGRVPTQKKGAKKEL